MPGSRSARHIPLTGAFRIGDWDINVLCEQRDSGDQPAETFLVTYAFGRIRLVVVDPALNDLYPNRNRLAAVAWGRVEGELRSNPDPFGALHAANAAIYDGDAGWLAGPMLCVAVVDLAVDAPLMLAAVRAGDTEIWAGDNKLDPVLTGSCFESVDETEWMTARRADGLTGADPARWALQTAMLTARSYRTTPLGVAPTPTLQTWGPRHATGVLLTTDGAAGDSAPDNVGVLLDECSRAPGAGTAFPHGDRAVIHARFVPPEMTSPPCHLSVVAG